MKKIVIIIAVLTLNFELSTLNSYAQANGGFEDWSTQVNFERPDNWQTFNVLSLFSPPNPISAFKATGVDKHSGNYALKLKSVYINNNPAPNLLQDTIGGVFTGRIILSPPSVKPGVPYTGRPEKMEFWAKYIAVGADYGGVFVVLQKWNGLNADTIAYGEVKIYSTLSYTLFQFNLDYHSTESPDTITIGIASSFKKSHSRLGSTLFIDDMALTGWVGINEKTNYADKVKTFPNPAKENITILAQIEEAENIKIVDVSGRTAGVYKIQNYSANINTGQFVEGVYFYEIQDKYDRVLTKGKFNVTK